MPVSNPMTNFVPGLAHLYYNFCVYHQTITLPDQRKLGFALYGPASGAPLLYFHGSPSSRLEPLLLQEFGHDLDALLLSAHVRLIAVDRPGMGLSTFNPDGSFLSFADDVAILAHQLFLDQCPVLSWSGGGPYALAVAHRCPDLITKVGIIAGISHYFDAPVFRQMGINKWYFRMAKFSPWLLQRTLGVLCTKKLNRPIPAKLTGFPLVDYELIRDVKHLNALADLTYKEACRNGTTGAVYEARLYCREFGFSLADIHQPVHYWWGNLDSSVSIIHAETVEKEISSAIMHYRNGEGHLSMFQKGFPEALQIFLNKSAVTAS
jgi:pimeloyl-ACP methyl ester carboxylesterase